MHGARPLLGDVDVTTDFLPAHLSHSLLKQVHPQLVGDILVDVGIRGKKTKVHSRSLLEGLVYGTEVWDIFVDDAFGGSALSNLEMNEMLEVLVLFDVYVVRMAADFDGIDAGNVR